MKAKICLSIIVPLLLFAGCEANSKQDFVNTANTGTTAINVCAVGVKTGAINKSKAENIEIVVKTFEGCMIGEQGWYWYLKDPNTTPPPDVIACATNTVIEIVLMAKQAGLDVPETPKAADADIDLAKARLEFAATRYYQAVEDMWLLELDQ